MANYNVKYGASNGPISSDDPMALEKLKAKLEKLVKHQEIMKLANAAIRMKDVEKGNARLVELGYTDSEIHSLRTPDFCGRVGYPSYEMTNNNANIHRIEARIKELEKRQSEPAPEGWEFDGGQVVVNVEENRLQVVFDSKPDYSVREELKSNGFHWAPSLGVWQRQLTSNALYAAKYMKCLAKVA